jgi:hypoxanthine phosphoribosyltransferase
MPMIKKRYLSYADVHSQVAELARQITSDGWTPDYIVGLTRGGLLPAVLLSHWFGVPCNTLKVSLRDGNDESESNCRMSEDAYGYDKEPMRILIVDDINDTGATLEWIKRDWRNSCMPGNDRWDTVWHGNVRFAMLVNNLASTTKIDYAAMEVNKAEEDVWIEFPYENWWTTASSQ